MITVVLVDDHAVVRKALRLLLEQSSDLTIVGEAADGPEALELVLATKPTVTLLDITLPTLSGFAVCQELVTRGSETRVLLLTMHENIAYLLHALEVGASGFVPKTTDEAGLLAALRAVAAGQAFVPPTLAGALAVQLQRRVRHPGAIEESAFTTLTPREREVFDLVAQGRTTSDIAALLQLSPHTVHHHRNTVMQKLGIHDRSALVKYAIDQDLPLGGRDAHPAGPQVVGPAPD